MNLLTKSFIKLRNICQLPETVASNARRLDNLQKAVGRLEIYQQYNKQSKEIQENEFQVFSQWGEDGIIQFLIRSVEIERKIFVEFGVGNYLEANTRFLLQNNNWSGLVIDSFPRNIRTIKRDEIYWRYNLKAECAFITRDNINTIIKDNGIMGDIGLLSIDIDGNDYWIWEAIDCIEPCIVICEYNSLFGHTRKVTIPYNESFVARNAHWSGSYYGASIAAIECLATKKGYALIGSNSNGINLFFVRQDLVGNLPTSTAKQAYIRTNCRDSRDTKGKLAHLDFEKRLSQISDMLLEDVETGQLIKVKDLEQ